MSSPVLIVGAGPTGLVLALWLKKKGVPFRIIDKSQGPGETSRALAVQARTLEFYRQLEISDQVVAAGVTAPQLTLRRDGKVVAQAKIGALGKDMSFFPYLLFYSQDLHEALLCEVLKKMGVEVERETELVGLSQNEIEASVELRTAKGIERAQFQYVCGCDGAHSSVRHAVSVQFPGGTYSQVFFVADVMAQGELAEGGLQISVSPKDFCIVMPIKQKGSLRLTGLVPPESEKKENIRFDDVAESLRKNTGLDVQKVHWFSTYHVHHRVAERFRIGRVFLAGDAGHIHSPAGGQGMNTGIGDAINLAWKLAEVIHGRASERLLESYEIERRAFAKTLVQTTDRAFKLIASRSWIGSIFRTYLLPNFFAFITRFRFFLQFMFKTISQIRIAYRSSPLSVGHGAEVAAGDRLPWVRNSQGDNFECLKSLNWQAHIYGKADGILRRDLKAAGIPLFEFEWNHEAQRQGIKPGALYLIRPDGYIGMVSEVPSAEGVSLYLQGL